ncbi:hypothetical protein A2316_02650 [Candidatus Falkowbacteria bacterium RIFOXYB2_FULL_38_15]|uniref:Nudix hydrolase domain-containing protein n=1 Tax=Candidatus Falkowbacteria bacterium RIFOXYA2_FULL_38_12 TaxID=1797993 RepID=A0A1F5S373_9BACT|nr:MAG: hypothetical protein A2257_03020 [Candidatus Falkowbacteria bacterium RIFOXYA2_FULL_38_12]OGF32548.1 MAG: hypothetical protein A2316_02650 [Candidatus Falkowbacteria bacterium RIFOXYB2_FULL_38_15]OGF41986.1 MAG: hypothetical protein A2555_03980 [Candidatus Falkowbacteria bacterium RIFOXYD2_FULL_39_16]
MQKGIDYIGVAVVFLCHDGKGNYLFAKRSENCRDEHGLWDCGGGAIDFGENAVEALKREVKEEYCVDVLSYEFLGYRDVHRNENGNPAHWLSLDFKVLVNPEQVKNGEPQKFKDLGWFNLDNLPKPLHSQLPRFFDLYKDKI